MPNGINLSNEIVPHTIRPNILFGKIVYVKAYPPNETVRFIIFIKQIWKCIIQSMGAIVETRKKNRKIDFLVTFSTSIDDAIPSEWIHQCLINQRVEDVVLF